MDLEPRRHFHCSSASAWHSKEQDPHLHTCTAVHDAVQRPTSQEQCHDQDGIVRQAWADLHLEQACSGILRTDSLKCLAGQ